MGARTSVLIGVEVQDSDFWNVRVSPYYRCPNGHIGEQGVFCSQCGSRLTQRTETFSTDKVRQTCEHLGIDIEDFEQGGDLYQVAYNILHDFGPESIHVACKAHSEYSNSKNYSFVLGIAILRTDEYQEDKDPFSISLEELQDITNQAKQLVEACGFDHNKVRVYSTKYVAY